MGDTFTERINIMKTIHWTLRATGATLEPLFMEVVHVSAHVAPRFPRCGPRWLRWESPTIRSGACQGYRCRRRARVSRRRAAHHGWTRVARRSGRAYPRDG